MKLPTWQLQLALKSIIREPSVENIEKQVATLTLDEQHYFLTLANTMARIAEIEIDPACLFNQEP